MHHTGAYNELYTIDDCYATLLGIQADRFKPLRTMNRQLKILFMLSVLAMPGAGCVQHYRVSALPDQPQLREPSPQSDNQTVLPAEVYYHVLRAQNCFAARNYGCALESYLKAHEYDSDSSYLNYYIALLLSMSGRLDEAVPYGRRAAADNGETSVHELLAKIYSSLERTEEAIDQYEILISRRPGNEQLHYSLALLYVQNGSREKAVDLLEDLIEKKPQSSRGFFYLGNLYVELQDYDKAVTKYTAALQISPDFEAPLMNLASLHEQQGRTREALDLYRKLAEKKPDNIRYLEKTAYLSVKNDQLHQALEYYNRLRTLHDELEEETTIKIGLIYYEQQKWDAAIREFRNVIEINSDNHRAVYYLANALEKSSDTQEALTLFMKIPPKSEFFSQSRIHCAFLMNRNGRLDAAQTVITEAISKKSSDIDLYRFYATLLEQQERYIDGINVLRTALAVSPDNEDLLFYLGVLYDKASMFEESIQAMQHVLEINGNSADALNFIGYTYADRGMHLDKAEEMIKKALSIKPGDGYILDSLGWVYFKKGRYRKAVKYLRKAFSIVPDDPVISEHLGDAYLKLNKREKAREMYDTSLELDPGRTEVQKKRDAL